MTLSVSQLNQRSLDIFRELVDAYMETGEPIGSRTISKRLRSSLSPATVRNIMADLEEAGLLYAPHTSAGRLPTSEGLRFFIHGLLEVGTLCDDERKEIEKRCQSKGQDVSFVLENVTHVLSGLSQCTSVIMAPKQDAPLKHVEFVHLAPTRALVVLVFEDGSVENRLIDIDLSLDSDILHQASQYLTAQLHGHQLSKAKAIIEADFNSYDSSLAKLGRYLMEQGQDGIKDLLPMESSLIVKGQSHLLDHITELNDVENIQRLFRILETKETVVNLINSSLTAPGIQIFIGSEHELFQLTGCSMVISPYFDAQKKTLGAIGVIGPTRMNYGKIIPLVDYTAKMIERFVLTTPKRET